MTSYLPLLVAPRGIGIDDEKEIYQRPLLLPNSSADKLLEAVRRLRTEDKAFHSWGDITRFDPAIDDDALGNSGRAATLARMWEAIEAAKKAFLHLQQQGAGNPSAEESINSAEKDYLSLFGERGDVEYWRRDLHHPVILFLKGRLLLENGSFPDAYSYFHRALINIPATQQRSSTLKGRLGALTNKLPFKSSPTTAAKRDYCEEEIRYYHAQLSIDTFDNIALRDLIPKLRLLRQYCDAGKPLDLHSAYFQHVYHTVRIEDCPTTLAEVSQLLCRKGLSSIQGCEDAGEGGSGIQQGARLRGEEAEINGAANAFYHLLQLVGMHSPLLVESIHKLHSLLMGEVDSEEIRLNSGRFKEKDIENGGARDLAPVFERHMKEFLVWYNSEAWPDVYSRKVDVLLVAAISHFFLSSLHPYEDGNGRMSRLLMNFTLMSAGWPPIIIPAEQKVNYTDALIEAHRGDLRPFVRFLNARLEETVETMLSTPATPSEGETSGTEGARTSPAYTFSAESGSEGMRGGAEGGQNSLDYAFSAGSDSPSHRRLIRPLLKDDFGISERAPTPPLLFSSTNISPPMGTGKLTTSTHLSSPFYEVGDTSTSTHASSIFRSPSHFHGEETPTPKVGRMLAGEKQQKLTPWQRLVEESGGPFEMNWAKLFKDAIDELQDDSEYKEMPFPYDLELKNREPTPLEKLMELDTKGDFRLNWAALFLKAIDELDENVSI